MTVFQLLLVALSVALDAFAVSVARGIAAPTEVLVSGNGLVRVSFAAKWYRRLSDAGIVGLWFGTFQAVMALVGYFVGGRLAFIPAGLDRWIVAVIFLVLAIFMMKEVSKPGQAGTSSEIYSPRKMAPLAFATSIDSLAIGVTLSLTASNPWTSIGLIGTVTFVLSAMGFVLGIILGRKLESVSKFLGAALLLLLAVKAGLGL